METTNDQSLDAVHILINDPVYQQLYKNIRSKRARSAISKLEQEYIRCRQESKNEEDCIAVFMEMSQLARRLGGQIEKIKAVMDDIDGSNKYRKNTNHTSDSSIKDENIQQRTANYSSSPQNQSEPNLVKVAEDSYNSSALILPKEKSFGETRLLPSSSSINAVSSEINEENMFNSDENLEDTEMESDDTESNITLNKIRMLKNKLKEAILTLFMAAMSNNRTTTEVIPTIEVISNTTAASPTHITTTTSMTNLRIEGQMMARQNLKANLNKSTDPADSKFDTLNSEGVSDARSLSIGDPLNPSTWEKTFQMATKFKPILSEEKEEFAVFPPKFDRIYSQGIMRRRDS